MFIGSTDPGGALHGKIDELRIYNQALTDQEVFTVAAWPAGALAGVWKSNATTTDWHTGANWVGEVVPGPEAEVTINACSTCPVLSSNVTIDRLRLEGGTLSLNGKTLSTQSIRFSESTLHSNGGSIQTNQSEWFIRNNIYGEFTYRVGHSGQGGGGDIRGANTFYGRFNLIVNPNVYCWMGGWYGANVFKEDVFVHALSGWPGIAAMDGMIFEKKAEFRSENGANLSVGYGGSLIFKDLVTMNAYSGGITAASDWGSTVEFQGPVIANAYHGSEITFGYDGNCTFHNSVTISNTSGEINYGGINFGLSNGWATFKSTATLQLGAAGFQAAHLKLNRVTYENTTQPLSLHLVKVHAADPIVLFGANSVFQGAVTVKAPHIKLNGATFHGPTQLEKTSGTSYVYWPFNLGGNVFNGPTTLTNSGGYDWYFGQNAKDVFNGDLTVNHSGGGVTGLSHWNAGHEFNGNVTVNKSDNSWGGIYFGGHGGSSQLKEGKTLTAGNFNTGFLVLHGLTQQGTTPQMITLTGSAHLHVGWGNVFKAPLTVKAPQLYLYGTRLYKPSLFTKTADGQNNSPGYNLFYDKIRIVNQATAGTINLATDSPDQFLLPPLTTNQP
jgi:hypothetical protein